MRLTARCLLALLFAVPIVQAAEIAAYPNATSLTGAERILADQNGSTVNISPNAFYSFLFPAGYLPASLMPSLTGDCSTTSGSFAITCGKSNGVAFSSLATAPTATSIISLFSACSGAQYLAADGACHSPAGGGTVTSVALSTPSWLTAAGGPITTSGTIALTSTTQSANTFLAAPNGSPGALTPRAIVPADLPSIPLGGSQVSGVLPVGSGGTGTAGSVTGIVKANGNAAQTAAAFTDVRSLWSGACSATTYLRGDGTCFVPPGLGSVNSVGLTAPSIFAVAGSPVSSSGTLALTFANGQPANQFLASPNGTAGAVGLRSLVGADVPAINLAASGNGGVTGNLPVTNLAGGVGATATSVWCGNGTWCHPTGSVSSVGFTAPSVFAVSGSPLTSAGTLGITFAPGQPQNQILATPNGASGAVGLRSLVISDLPPIPLTASILNGILPVTLGGTGESGTVTGILVGNGASPHTAATAANVIGMWSGACSSVTYLRGDGSCQTPAGAVTSVGLTAPSWLSVSNTPVTTSGTIAITGTPQSANFVLASPNGAMGALTPRALVAADLPAISLSTQATGTLQAAQEPAFTGDVSKSAGSLATTVTRVNGLAVPTAAAVLASNSSNQLIPATVSGTGSVAMTSGSVINLASSSGLPLSTGISGVLAVANGGTGSNTLTGLLKGTGATIGSASVNDILGLFGSNCSSATYLNGAGGCTAPAGAGTVTSVGLTVPSWLNVTGSPITGSGTLAIGTAGLSQNLFLATPDGNSGILAPRAITINDIPAAGTGTLFVQVSANTTLNGSNTSVLVNAAAGPITITLPNAVGDNHLYIIKKIDASANPVTVITLNSQTIDGLSTSGLGNQFSSMTVKSDNANWWLI